MPGEIQLRPTDRVRALFEESVRNLEANVGRIEDQVAEAAERLVAALLSDHKILACGNGGSAADAIHFTGELLGRYLVERPSLPAVALNADVSALTAIGNDYGYDQIFARQVQGLGRPGDVLLAITTSGNSPNVIAAVTAAQAADMSCVTLSGKGGGRLSEMMRPEDIEIIVDGDSTPRIQEVHGLVVHCLCDLVDFHLTGHAQ